MMLALQVSCAVASACDWDAGLLQQRCTEMPAAVQLTAAGALGL